MRAAPARGDRICSPRRGEQPQGGFDRRGHVSELPADLLPDSVWPSGVGQPSCLGGIRRGAQGVRAHMGDGCGLSRRAGGSRCRGSAHLTSGRTVDKPAADRFRDAKLPTSEGPRPGDRGARAAVSRSLRLKHI